MGAEPWSYWVPYRANIEEAFEILQQQEFAAGRYDKPEGFVGTHATIEEAAEDNDADGTRSILDMTGVADSPRNPDLEVFLDEPLEFDSVEDMKFRLVTPLSAKQLVLLFGTERPTREMIQSNPDYSFLIDRGLGLYIVAYDGDSPSEILFKGYSFD